MPDQADGPPDAAQPGLLPEPATERVAAYRVLARKYRPSSFAELIGQDVLVRTLSNAITTGRLAHAFILTGVRGTGKTSTARILARALNCVGPDGTGGPTPSPCGQCEACLAIAADRHVDVMEMDAATRTSVDDIRELIDGVRYAPVSARYKVYIIDEVHMLSRNAFNALLKTLEEPPPHVKFVFATTEIRKVPVTVLSRCQRFDLRRVDVTVLAAHFAAICRLEGVSASDDALALIARAADGSVRDGLSLLDQAMAQTALGAETAAEGGMIDADQVARMLGLTDRTRIIDLFEAMAEGRVPEALAVVADLHQAGGDPLLVVQDLMAFATFVARAKLVPAVRDDRSVPEAERLRGGALADRLAVAVVDRAWQLLLKGAQDVQSAASPIQALEMLVIRVAFAAGLPTPGDVMATLAQLGIADQPGAPAPAPHAPAPGAPAPQSMPAPQPTSESQITAPAQPAVAPVSATGARGEVTGMRVAAVPSDDPPAPAAKPAMVHSPVTRGAQAPHRDDPPEAGAATPEAVALAAPLDHRQGDAVGTPDNGDGSGTVAVPASFAALVELFGARGEVLLHGHLYAGAHCVSYAPGRVELRLNDGVPPSVPGDMARLLREWTQRQWLVTLSGAPGGPTLAEAARAARVKAIEDAAKEPLVRAILDGFPDAAVVEVREYPPAGAGVSGDFDGDPESDDADDEPIPGAAVAGDLD